MSLKTNMELLLISARIDADNYRQKYDELKRVLKERNAEIEANYVKTKPKYAEEKERAQKDFEKAVKELQVQTLTNIKASIDEARENEKYRVARVDEKKLAKLQALSEVPLSAEELLAFCEQNAITEDYWASRMLRVIAEKNAIDISGYLEASYATKISVLDQIEDQARELLRDYDTEVRDGETRQRVKYILLSEDVCKNALKIWQGKHNVVSDDDFLSKAYLQIYARKNDIDKGLVMSNLLRNATGEKRNALLAMIAKDETISEIAGKMSGSWSEIKEFKDGAADMFFEAKKAVSEWMKLEDNDSKKKYISDFKESNPDNKFFSKLLKEGEKSKEIFDEFVGDGKLAEIINGTSGEEGAGSDVIEGMGTTFAQVQIV